MKKIIVCGGRRYADRAFVYRVLDFIHQSLYVSCVVHGDAGGYDKYGNLYGADRLAGEWAEENGIFVKKYPVLNAHWKRYGKRAGILRNAQMLDHESPDFVVAFTGGNGTRHMVNYALGHGVDVLDAATLRIIPARAIDVEEIDDD